MAPESQLYGRTFIGLTPGTKKIALTYDDGPNDPHTLQLLEVLARHNVRATFFMIGRHVRQKPEVAREVAKAGHAIGNHTMTHLDLDKKTITLEQYQQELLDCDAVISKLPGYQKWFRFTYLREGNTPEKRDGMRAFLKAQNYRIARTKVS